MLTWTGLLLCSLSGASVAETRSQAIAAPDVRQTLGLAEGWRFKQDDNLKGAEAPGFPDANWAVVSVPHTWNRVGYYIPDPEAHANRAGNVNKAQGIGWYRLAFTPPASINGKKAWLQFDAASRVAQVWLNGTRLGEHRGGFSRFRLDASAAIRPGKPNILVVRTDNSKPEPGSSTADVLPLGGDFFVHGGLYRPVNLVTTNLIHIDMLDFGGPGVYATTTSVRAGRAQIVIRARLRNDGPRPVEVELVTRLLAADGRVAAEAVSPASLAAGAGTELPQTLVVPNPHLWQGTEDPYLYRLQVELRDRRGAVLDRLDQSYGIRQMRFDPERGFFLNDKPLRLHGVGYHQDREGKGWAVSERDVEQDVRLLREMGANTIRLTHYQHGQWIHDLADREGLVLWDEIPLVSAWTLGTATQPTPELRANALQQLRELIRQNLNHPSVASWGIANEVDFGAILPFFLGLGKGSTADPMPLLRELNGLAKSEDLSRPTALASCCEGGVADIDAEVPVTAPATDVAGANRYLGWYSGKVEDLGPHLDALHAKRPWQPLALTEYGAGGATTMHTDNVLGGPVDSGGRTQPEEFESFIHERSWAVLRTKPYLWATWLWNSFDFATTVRREGDANDINTKGLITYDRKIRKDPYFFYKANWTDTPTVHINGRRYVDRAYRVTDVRVYSNAPETELFVNGSSAGVTSACSDSICLWRGVQLKQGANVVVAVGRFPAGSVEDRVSWRLAKDNESALRIDSGAIVAGPSSRYRFGSDNFFQGGESGSVNKPSSYGNPAQQTPIAGTEEDEIAATFRQGDFTYRLPLPNGRYTATLTFIEPSAAGGDRIFDVLVNGRRVIRRLDIAKTARTPLTAIRRTFPVKVANGLLELSFKPVRGQAVVSAIEVSR